MNASIFTEISAHLNAVIGDQGVAAGVDPQNPNGIATDNRWIANQGPVRSEGSLDVNAFSPTIWYVRNGQINQPQPSIDLEDDFDFETIILSGNPTSSCSVGGPIGPAPTSRSRMFGGIANGTNAYSQFPIDQNYWEATNTTRFFAPDTAWLHQDPADDSVYQQWYQTQRNGNTGNLIMAEMALADLDTATAIANCAAVNPNCQKEDNLLAVYQLAATRYLSESTTLDGADTTWLEYVACLDPLTEGAAVYSARAMLVWPFGCAYDMRSMKSDKQSGHIEDAVSVQVYPNPTTGLLFVECDQQITGIRVFDMFGKVVLEMPLVNLNVVNLDLNALANGMYLLELNGDEFSNVQRVIKQ